MRILVAIAVCMALSLTYERFAIASQQPQPGSAADTRVSSTTLSVLTGSSYDRAANCTDRGTTCSVAQQPAFWALRVLEVDSER
jgi:hypothetical protein